MKWGVGLTFYALEFVVILRRAVVQIKCMLAAMALLMAPRNMVDNKHCPFIYWYCIGGRYYQVWQGLLGGGEGRGWESDEQAWETCRLRYYWYYDYFCDCYYELLIGSFCLEHWISCHAR